MTNEQAESELMQIYMSLSEEKKQALDVLMAQADGEYISRKALLEDLYKRDYTKFTHRDFVALVQYQDIVAIPNKTKTGHCEDCKHFRKLPYHAGILGKCIHHGGFCPKGDWYCADFEPQESEDT